MHNRDISPSLKEKLWETGQQLEGLREGLRERKTERLQLRVTPTEKNEIQWVTELLGVSESDYLMHLHRRALKELDRKSDRTHTRMRRNRDDDSSAGSPARK